jgi:proteasome alpha subunit
MEIFESDYKEDMDIDAAIMLGMKALYTSTEGKLDAATLELGIVTLENRQFRKLSREEVSGFVSRISEELKDNIKEEKDESEKQDSEE